MSETNPACIIIFDFVGTVNTDACKVQWALQKIAISRVYWAPYYVFLQNGSNYRFCSGYNSRRIAFYISGLNESSAPI